MNDNGSQFIQNSAILVTRKHWTCSRQSASAAILHGYQRRPTFVVSNAFLIDKDHSMLDVVKNRIIDLYT